MAANLYINDGKTDVSVGELGVILGKQQVILGDFERDFILRTAGNIKIQVGNKLYNLPYSTTTGSTPGVTVNSTATTILATEAGLSTLTYPGDGNLVFVTEDSAFYVCSGGHYLLVAKATTVIPNSPTKPSPIYLSYDTTQILTGDEKLTVILNTGSYINKLSDVSGYAPTDVYTNQLVYSILDGRHYRLTDPLNPSLIASWSEVYLSLSGGNVLGNITISTDNTVGQTLSALHVSGDYVATQVGTLNKASSLFTIGAKDLTEGLAIWTNSGNVYLESLSANSGVGFNFLTNDSLGALYQPLTMFKGNVGINGPVNNGYALAVNGSLFLLNNLNLRGSITSSDFLTGPNGRGFSISRDSSDKWTLEIDELVVRDGPTSQAPTFSTQGVDGSLILNYNIMITDADFVESIPIYISAQTAGRYSDMVGTIKPLASRAQYVNVVHSTLASLDTNTLVPSYDLIKLSYAIGDRDSSNVLDTSVTYNQAADSSYYTPTGTTSYDSGTMTFIPGGTLLLINTINNYYIQSDCLSQIVVGDLLYFKQWDDSKQFVSAIHAEVVKVDSAGYYVYVYDNQALVAGMQFIKVGNTTGTGNFIQLNSADLNSPFIELLTGVETFNDFYENYYYEQYTDLVILDDLLEDSWSVQSQTRFKIGDLSNIVDSTLLLTTQQYGLYSDNAYLKGNFVVNHGIYNNLPVVTSYENFVMLHSDNTLEQVDMSVPFAYWNAKADDILVVHLSGAETITGVKTFAYPANTKVIHSDGSSVVYGGQGLDFSSGAQILQDVSANLYYNSASHLFQSGGSTYASINALTGVFLTVPMLIGTTYDLYPTAILQLDSTSQGFLPPRLTSSQKTALLSIPEGLIVYDSTLHKLCLYTGTAWETITSI